MTSQIGDFGGYEQTERLRTFFARYVAARGIAGDPRIEAAFASVPREPFAGRGPWSILATGRWNGRSNPPRYVETPDDDPAYLYQDVLIALDRARGINIGEPSLHARCLNALKLKDGETVLQIGAGSGYYSAIIAELVGPSGRVHAFEIEPALAERATLNLSSYQHVTVEPRSGAVEGLPSADAIYVNAGITQPQWAWLEALRPEGRLLFPLQAPWALGGMLLIEKPAGGGLAWPARFVSSAIFIACQARQDDATARELRAAFAAGGYERVRSIRFDDAPDASCWFRGSDWWLSVDAPEQ
jgi:protein-L-isoaspartate(D-aspartate) O-methyltransferase